MTPNQHQLGDYMSPRGPTRRRVIFHKLAYARRLSGAVLVGVIGFQGFSSPAMASSRAIPATGSVSIAVVGTPEVVQQGQQCVIYVEQVLTYSGTLEGIATTVGPAQLRFYATCAELIAAGGIGIPREFSAVEHFVSIDGKEATFREVGRANSAGDFHGTIALHGDLNGSLRTAETAASGPVTTYEGQVVVID